MQDPNQASQNAPGQDATAAQPANAQHAAELGLAPGMDAAAVASAADAAPENGIDRMPSLEDALRQAELKAAEHHDAWLRAKAETENVRRRAQDDIAKVGKYAVEKFSGELLAVKRDIEFIFSAFRRLR